MTVSGYSTKYLFEFNSLNGTYYRIRIQKKNYSGSVITRALGQAPVLKRESGDNGIYGTSLEIYAECATDGEFAELYTSSATEFYVTLGRVVNNTEAVIWSGFVSPELYAEPDIAPPYDVQIIATDGLGELKRYEYASQGRKTILQYLQYLLASTGQSILTTDYLICNSLHPTDPAITVANMFNQVYINMDHLAGKTCYDVLVDLLTSFHFTITQLQNKWILMRENDISLSSGNLVLIDGNGSSVSLPTEQFGSMASYSWWPIDQLEKEIVPAKNKVTIVQPYNFRPSMLDNYNFDALTAWTNSNAELVSGVGVRLKPVNPAQTYLGYVRQTIGVENNENGFNLVMRMAMVSKKNGTVSTKAMEVEVQVKLSYNSTTYYLKSDDEGNQSWESTENSLVLSLDPKTNVSSYDDLDEQNISIIPLLGSGNITIEVKNLINDSYSNILYIGDVCFYQNEINGYKDVISINNQAREELEEIEITLGDAPSGEPNLIRSIYNVLTYVQSPTKKWTSTKITPAANFIKVIAQDYALSYALPRLRTSGKLNVPLNGALPPLFRDSSVSPLVNVVEEWTWDLLNDEVDIKLLSAPAANITITSEVVSVLTNAEYGNTATGRNSTSQSSSKSSGGGGGGTGGGGTVTQVATGEGLTGGPITTSGTIAIAAEYLTKINNGQTAYVWGNHANQGYATQAWVGSQGYVNSSAISDMATKSWVNQQGFVSSSSISDMATKSWVAQQGYVVSSAISDMATKTWVGQQGFVTSATINDMATKTWVEDNYLALTGGSITGNLEVSGTVQATEITATSDMRLKTNVTELPSILSLVERLDYFFHDWKDRRGPMTIGLSAQQLLDSPLKCLVRQGSDGYYSVAYDKLAVVALKAIAELAELIKKK